MGSAQKGNVQFNGSLTNGPGHLNLGGTAVVIGNPQYHIAVDTKHFNIAGISKSAPLTDLNSRAVIQGSGSNLQKIDARIDFQASRSLIARVPLESAIQAQIKGGVIDISQAKILSQIQPSASKAARVSRPAPERTYPTMCTPIRLLRGSSWPGRPAMAA
jgi:hypothetical protein